MKFVATIPILFFVAFCCLAFRVDAEDPARFDREVASSLTKLGCNSGTCHGSLHGKGGFRLSLRGQDPELDFYSIVQELNGRRIDLLDSEQSLLLAKPSGAIAHQGGLRLPKESQFYSAIRDWIQRGAAPPNQESASRIKTLSVEPREAWISFPNNQQQLRVYAQWWDGSRSDVTSWARFETSSIDGAKVTEDGLVSAAIPIDTSISVFYLGQIASSRLIFLPADSSQGRTSTAQNASNRIDFLVQERLRKLGLTPGDAAPPNLLVRRIYLTVLGRLPTVEEQDQFLSANSHTRIQECVDRLISDPGYSNMWAMRWSDLLRNEPKVMSERGVAKWHEWLRQSIADDKPMNEMVMEMITSLGSTYDHPPASFHRTHRDPTIAAESVGQVFLGIRMQCAKCHNHPFDVWTQDDYYGLAAYFTTLERKAIDNMPRDKLDTHIITGDEIISMNSKPATVYHPGRSKMIAAKGLGEPVTIAEQAADSASENPLVLVARWVGQNNRQFARNMANRVWSQLIGRGIVDPVDDFRNTNPPSNPELLEYLTDRFMDQDYSIQSLTREILLSQTFSRTSHPPELESTREQTAAANFAFFGTRRMSAEVLHDAILDFTGTVTQLKHNTNPDSSEPGDSSRLRRAVEFPSVPKRDSFLKTFGKPDRLIDCECERSNDLSLRQSLLLVNDSSVRSMLHDPNGNCAKIAEAASASSDKTKLVVEVARLFRIGLCRSPTEAELAVLRPYLESGTNRKDAVEDIAWAILNSKEFLFIR